MEPAAHLLPERWPLAAVPGVDDEPGMRNLLQKTLAPRAGLVLAAGSAEEAEGLAAAPEVAFRATSDELC
jgi:hypothetical protein